MTIIVLKDGQSVMAEKTADLGSITNQFGECSIERYRLENGTEIETIRTTTGNCTLPFENTPDSVFWTEEPQA